AEQLVAIGKMYGRLWNVDEILVMDDCSTTRSRNATATSSNNRESSSFASSTLRKRRLRQHPFAPILARSTLTNIALRFPHGTPQHQHINTSTPQHILRR